MISAARLLRGLRPLPSDRFNYLRVYANGYKKRSGTNSGDLLKKSSNVLNNKSQHDANAITSSIAAKIVQVRSGSTRNSIPEVKVNPASAFSSSSSSSSPSGPSFDSSKNEKPPEKSNTLRNILLGLAVAVSSSMAIYYFDLLNMKGGDDEKKKKTLKDTSRPINRYPKTRAEFPSKMPYVLIGGGTASFAAFRAIKSKDPKAKILIVSEEDSIPYMRPPLSKEIWKQTELPKDVEKLTFKQWNGQERSLYYEPSDFYMKLEESAESEKGGVVVATGWKVNRVDATTKIVYVIDHETGTEFPLEYEKCLIATGSKPKNLPVFEKVWKTVSPKTILYRNIRDLENLWSKIENAKSIAIVGGGFLGSELACSLGRKFKDNSDKKVIQIFKEPGHMGRVLPEYLSKWTTHKVVEEGVKVITSVEVQDVKMVNDQVQMKLSNEESITADVVVVAVGSKPRTELADSSYLEVDPNLGGFLVNAELESRSSLFVAGDAACFYDPILGRRRVEHHDHAVVSGRLAGENMVSGGKPYHHQSMFWSDLGPDVGYEAIGIIDADLPTVSVFAKSSEIKRPNEESDENKNSVDATEEIVKPQDNVVIESDKSEKATEPKEDYNKGLIFYLKDGTVVGIILWNVFNKMHIARQILSQRSKYEDLNELAKHFNLHDEPQ